MKKLLKNAISLIISAAMTISVIPHSVFAENDNLDFAIMSTEEYICDFSQLVKNNADTVYGTADDIIVLDDYTTAYLTYEGTYVTADGKVYLYGSNSGKGAYTNGSYIEFTAPCDGTLTPSFSYTNYYINGSYAGYSAASVDLKEGQKYQLGERANGRSYVTGFSFVYDIAEPTDEPADNPTSAPVPEDIAPYSSPSTVWDFNEFSPSQEGKNIPVISGNAEWDEANGEVKFLSDTTAGGSVSVDFDEAIKNNVSIEFDSIGHKQNLGQQYISFSVSNSEEKIIDFTVHPYDDTRSGHLTVCSNTISDNTALRKAWTSIGTTHIKASVDYTARKITVTVGTTEFSGDIPEGTVSDIKSFTASSMRAKTASDRYISLDNLSISEFTSDAEPAAIKITEGYSETNIAGFNARIKEQNGEPAVIYLASELRAGDDNVSQLYDAQYIFDKLNGSATLIAPQTEKSFTDISALVNEVRAQYNAPSVTVIGQSQSAAAALSSGADKVITVAGSADAKSVLSATKSIWVFAGYTDTVTPVLDVKTMVNNLQTDGINTLYTEYPFDAHKINNKTADEDGLREWILNDNADSRIVDLVLFSGQSNMAGRGDYAQSVTCPAGQGYEYHSVTEPAVLSNISEPFGKYENNSALNDNSSSGADRRSGDMVAALMSSYYAKTGVPMVGVQASRGGQATTYFLASSVMSEMQRRFNDAADYLEKSGYTIRKKCLVWCQGEADADSGRSDSSFKSNTLSIFNQIKSATGITDVFIVQTGHYNINYGVADGSEPGADAISKDAVYKRISDASGALAQENDNIYSAATLYTDEYLALMRDQYHYYQPVYNSVGKTAGEAIADIYSDEPVPTAAPLPTEAPTPAPTDKPGADYAWNFDTDQTAASENNAPIISGTAAYDETNKNIKLNSDTKTAGEIKVNLSPAAEGVITAEFDANFGQLGQLNHIITLTDSGKNEIVSLTADVYNASGTIKICGETVAADREFTQYINSYRGDGMSAAVTHFAFEINYLKKTAAVTITKNASVSGTFTGSISSAAANDIAEFSIKSVHSKYTTGRSSYIDNISISSYTPAASMYAAGALSVTKRLGTDVTEQYELSKTYTDDTETAEWSVSGVTGVTIDKNTGVLTVPETAGTGTARVSVTLTQGGTLATGTSDTIEVTIKDFAAPKTHTISGASTIEAGKTSAVTIKKLIDTDGNDITKFAALNGFKSDNSAVAAVSEGGTITANNSGTANITFTLSVEKLNYSEEITLPIRAGVFEITASDEMIDASKLISYGTDTYRVYGPDKSYTDVKAENGRVKNPTDGEVTVVPVYRFNYTNAAMEGYAAATGAYSAASGYGLLSGGSYSTNANGSLPTGSSTLRADLPYGNYDINILRKGGARADVYNDGVQIINNSTSSGSQNRPSGSGQMYAPQILIEDGSMDITIGNLSGSNERIASIEIVRVPDKYKKSIIWIAGDSESANYYPVNADGDDLENDKIMMTGFGMQLNKFLSEDYYKVANWGQPSATVKTWYNECFNSIISRIEKGDTLIIDFGINDAISSSNAISIADMKECMSEIFTAVKAKGASVILVSPVYNAKYQHRTYFTYSNGTNAMYDFAKEEGVPCIDLNKGLQLYKDNAVLASGDSGWVTNNYHVGDNLHLTQHSAVLASAIIAGGMKELGYHTTDYSYTYSDLSSLNGTSRGELSGVTREYSINALADYITVDGEKSIINPHGLIASISYDGSNITVASSDNSLTSAVLIKASYAGNGIMTSIDSKELSFNDNKALVKMELSDGDTLYLWDSFSSMKPLAKVYKYTSGSAAEPTAEPTAAPTPEPTPVPTLSPTPVVLYSQNFESYSVGDKGGWTSPAGTLAIKNDTTSGIGNYQTVVSGKSGTCRSGYVEIPAINDNFVFECDYKSSGNANVSDLELLESKSSVYANHGVYSNRNFVFTMARPSGSDLYVINNKADDSGFNITSYTEPVFTTKEIASNPWLHVKIIGSFDTQTIIVYITSLDGKTEYYSGVHDMNVGRNKQITSWKCIHLLSPSTGSDTCIDNILITKASESDLNIKYHKTAVKCGKVSVDQYVLDGQTLAVIPDVSLYGDNFDGWSFDDDEKLYSSSELAAAPITKDCTIIGHINESYIEAIDTVEFNAFPAGGELVMGEDENTYGSNEISLTITGEQGTSLVTSPDERVTDYKIEWSFDGFRTLDGRATGETGSVYCDSYGLVEITKAAQPSVNFRLKRTAANYYGRVTAKVTYNKKTVEVSRPLVLLADKSADSSAILPAAGYASDYNKYDSALSGYTFSNGDTLFGNWKNEGSDGSRYQFLNDSTGNYLRLIRNGSGNTTYGYYAIGNLGTQTIFEQDVRFNYDGSIQYTGGGTTSISSTAFTLSMSSSKLVFNKKDVCSASRGVWYHIVICIDPTTKKAWAKVYDITGETLLGESGTVDFYDTAYTSGNYYRINPSKAANSSIDLNNVVIKAAKIDNGTIVLTIPQTADIPKSGTTSVNLSVSAKTTEGYDATGKAEWKIGDEFASGVNIESTGEKTASLTISPEASSGDLPIIVTINGVSQTVSLRLIGTKDNVAFTSASAGAMIPESGNVSYQYSASVRNGKAEDIQGRTVTYELYNADNSAVLTADGISIDKNTGKLTVSSNASPQTVFVTASSTDSDGDAISKFVKVSIYNLKFDFGTSARSGYTNINANTAYSDSLGYGIEGAAEDNGTTVDGAYTIKVKLEKGRVYNVNATYNGNIRCESVSGFVNGFERSNSSLSSDSYSVAVFGDDIMDITFPASGQMDTLVISPVAKTQQAKPDWWTIGDSTIQQNGSWAYTITSDSTNDLSKYPELSKVVSGFHNSGRAGRQHKSYYTEGLLNSVLCRMNPGDVVSISGMGVNDSSSSQAQFKLYDEIYTNAIIDMGGYVILGSYTPSGNYGSTQGKVYDADTMTFKGMRTDAYDRAIRELYDEVKSNDRILGFLDIGKLSDETMTADVKAVYDAAIESGANENTARAAANTRAEEMMSWWKDYNHYYAAFSNYILPGLTKSAAELIEKIK